MSAKMQLDNWQEEVIAYEGDLVLRSGRQVGKSTAVGKKAKNFALKYANSTQMVMAASQRQSWHLFEKIIEELEIENQKSTVSEIFKFKSNSFV